MDEDFTDGRDDAAEWELDQIAQDLVDERNRHEADADELWAGDE